MDNRKEAREFLTSRRAKITPEDAGLPNFGGSRRVPGLRREEVALLAGVSAEYYTRLERGSLAGVSDAVLDALARALQLDAAEREHLVNLARAACPTRSIEKCKTVTSVQPRIQRILDGMVEIPAFVRNGRLDILAINELGLALYSEAFHAPARPVNLARFQFLDPGSYSLYPDWEKAADAAVALLHIEAGRDPFNKNVSDLIGELATRSSEFRTRWARRDVRLHSAGSKVFRHPVVGAMRLSFDAMELQAGSGLTLTAYTAEPGSQDEDGLRLLASWAAAESHDTEMVEEKK